jgi:leucyl-tRNA synthetase
VPLFSAASSFSADEEMCFMDRAFNNEIDFLIAATFAEYDKMCYRDGIHRAWFDMMIVRDFYRDWSLKCNVPMHQTVALRFVDAVAVMMAPITPHWCEHVWGLLGRKGTVNDAAWPAFQPADRMLRKEYLFFRDFLKNIRMGTIKLKVASPKYACIYLASTYEAVKVDVLLHMQGQCDAEGKFPSDFIKGLKPYLESQPQLLPHTKPLMQFASFMKDEANERGADALAVVLPFDQRAIIQENTVYVLAALDLDHISILDVEDAAGASAPNVDKKKMGMAVPGKPSFSIYVTTEAEVARRRGSVARLARR